MGAHAELFIILVALALKARQHAKNSCAVILLRSAFFHTCTLVQMHEEHLILYVRSYLRRQQNSTLHLGEDCRSEAMGFVYKRKEHLICTLEHIQHYSQCSNYQNLAFNFQLFIFLIFFFFLNNYTFSYPYLLAQLLCPLKPNKWD